MDAQAVGWVDIALLAVMVVSTLIGALRGLTFEVLSLAGWVAAWFAGVWFGPWLAPYLPIADAGSTLNAVAAFACAFLVVLVLWGLAARAVSSLVRATLLRPVDRLLGAGFGMVRGAVVLLVFATLVAYTPVVDTVAWRDSIGAGWLNAAVRQIVPYLAPRRDQAPQEQSV